MLIVVLVLGTTMFVTGVLSLRARCCEAYFIYCGSWCCRTNVSVTGGMSQEPRSYVAVYFSLSSGESTNTSSHMCDSWYLPIFLLRDGWWTLMRIASLMDLAIFLSVTVGTCIVLGVTWAFVGPVGFVVCNVSSI